ncbi:MAG: polysaccharide lyase beta-sandwich domain-containing protein [Vallitalea sp.]|jgi:hypothetical protein|nr:polysaccharide lyase beta-sandwich domain-containing protein [Vallitalea sp.]
MKFTIRDEILLSSYYETAYTCNQCEYKLKKNNDETYKKKQIALNELLTTIAQKPFKQDSYKDLMTDKGIFQYESLLNDNGYFSDIGISYEDALLAIRRLACIIEVYHWKIGKPWPNADYKNRVIKSIGNYCKIEADREDQGYCRFHNSIFMFPTCSINVFFGLLPDMMAVESGNANDVTIQAYKQLLRIGMQPWLLPLRHDHTDEHPISPERFRKHVHWVTANAISYRPIVYCAYMFRSVEMMDTIVHTITHMLTPVSSTNVDTAYWCEGICSDGFGWGHGRQTYNTGYPLHSVITCLEIMDQLHQSPWLEDLTHINPKWLLNFLRSITWGVYKGVNAPMMGRHMYSRDKNHDNQTTEYYVKIIMNQLLKHYKMLLSTDEVDELEYYLSNSNLNNNSHYNSNYKGIKYFFNNDVLIKKDDKSYFYINMASSRCDGVECADIMADTRNFYVADGSYVIMKHGHEYENVMGTWNASMLPGVTTRALDNHEIISETNWHGYNSIHNYAGGVYRDNNGACGFIYEKNGERRPDGAGVLNTKFTKKMLGVIAHKSYFILGDTMICLGAGITDKNPSYGKYIRTTINNTLCETDINVYNKQGKLLKRYSNKTNELLDSNCYIQHNKILYGSYKCNEKIHLYSTMKKTNWLDHNIVNNDVKNTLCPVFELYIDHGSNIENEDYAYFIYTGEQEPKDYIRNQLAHLVVNTTSIQAIENIDRTICQAIFYDNSKACKFSKYTLRVSTPSVIMVEEETNGYIITVCDAMQNKNIKQITVTLEFNNHQLKKTINLCGIPEVGKPITEFINKP